MSITFRTAIEAQEYAKKNIGVTITRNSSGEGYMVKEKYKNNSISLNKNDKRLVNSTVVSDISISVANTLLEKNEVLNPDVSSESIEKGELVTSDTSSEVTAEVLSESLSPVSKTGIGLAGVGLLFGLPF